MNRQDAKTPSLSHRPESGSNPLSDPHSSWRLGVLRGSTDCSRPNPADGANSKCNCPAVKPRPSVAHLQSQVTPDLPAPCRAAPGTNHCGTPDAVRRAAAPSRVRSAASVARTRSRCVSRSTSPGGCIRQFTPCRHTPSCARQVRQQHSPCRAACRPCKRRDRQALAARGQRKDVATGADQPQCLGHAQSDR